MDVAAKLTSGFGVQCIVHAELQRCLKRKNGKAKRKGAAKQRGCLQKLVRFGFVLVDAKHKHAQVAPSQQWESSWGKV